MTTPDTPGTSSETSGAEIIITRIISAPPARVWQAFTNPDELNKWWGPDGFTTTTHSIDVRPGGSWMLTMHAPDGTDYPNHIIYDEVDPPHRLVYTHHDDGACFQHVITMEDHREGTQLTMRMIFPSPVQCEAARQHGVVEGAHQTFARLASHLTHHTKDTLHARSRQHRP